MKERLLFILIFVSIVNFASHCAKDNTRDYNFEEEDKYLKIFKEAYNIVKSRSLDKDISSTKLFDAALKGMFSSLGDPHSNYLNKPLFAMINDQVEGSFGGVGFAFAKRGEDFIVLYTLDGSPARKVGIRSRDIIVEISGQKVRGLNYLDFSKMIRGKPNSKIKITLLRNKKRLVFVLRRDIIEYNEVEYRVLEDNIAYIRLRQFSNLSAQRMGNILRKLRKRNINGIILDLRGNTGGSLLSCIYIVNYFISGKRKIVQIRASLRSEYIYSHNNAAIFPKAPLVILSDGDSASASEILIGAMQDYSRATVIGNRTYGKGSVQQLFQFQTNSNVGAKITYAKWYTPNGRIIDGRGLNPDIEVGEGEMLSSDEKYYAAKLMKSDMIYDYVNKHNRLSKKDIDGFIGIVRNKGFKLSDDTIIKLLKREKYMYSSYLVLDMEYDKVLSKAFSHILNKKKVSRFW